MSLNPIPLTTDSSDPNSPKGAIPVDIFGTAGGDTLQDILERLGIAEQKIEAIEGALEG